MIDRRGVAKEGVFNNDFTMMDSFHVFLISYLDFSYIFQHPSMHNAMFVILHFLGLSGVEKGYPRIF